MQYVNRLRAIREEKGITCNEISQISGIPLATVNRIFSGATPNPTIETLAPISLALGVSIDEIAGIEAPAPAPATTPITAAFASYADLLKEKDDRIKELKEEKERERKEKYKIAIALAAFVGFVLIILTVDILNGHFGYFRY